MIKVVERKYTIGQYIIFKDDEKNRVIIEFYGFLQKVSLSDFLNDYPTIKKSVKLSETILVLAASKLRVCPKDIEVYLGKLYRDYIDFKKVYVIAPENIVSRRQLERVFRIYGVAPYFEFINGLDEI